VKKFEFEWQKDVPKRNRNAYQVFCAHLRKQDSEKHTFKELTKIAGEKWKEMSLKDKHKYEVITNREKILHYWKLAEFKRDHPELYETSDNGTKTTSDSKLGKKRSLETSDKDNTVTKKAKSNNLTPVAKGSNKKTTPKSEKGKKIEKKKREFQF